VSTAPAAAVLVNLVGFLLGALLYGLLLAMVLRARAPASSSRLLLMTGLLGLLWNVGGMFAYGLGTPVTGHAVSVLLFLAFTALGFLPAVVVHSVVTPIDMRAGRFARTCVALAYLLSATAAGFHARAAIAAGTLPSGRALTILTVGFAGLIVALLFNTRGRRREGRALWVVALSVFAVSALHLGQHTGGESWWTEALGHHASVPLALAILHRDYRFALADIFLKRALSVTLLVGTILALHLGVGASWLASVFPSGPSSPSLTAYLLGLALAAALLHAPLRQWAEWFVDRVVLRRPPYAELTPAVGRELGLHDDPHTVLYLASRRLTEALDASWSTVVEITAQTTEGGHAPISVGAAAESALREMSCRPIDDSSPDPATLRGPHLIAVVPTVDRPAFAFIFGALLGGRRLLSDDFSLIEAVTATAGRRLDSIRVAHERYEASLREQQISRLATEAELRALRAQLNPHFLFNALTTIDYLIQAAPERAHATLLRLTSLLRGVLRRTRSEFSTLGEEIELVRAYLHIEEARFEERLRVSVAVPEELLRLRVPSLILQPLVENAVKHGIAPNAAGGEVTVLARLESPPPDFSPAVIVTIRDTGVGASPRAIERGRSRGLGISSVERRLDTHYGKRAALHVSSDPYRGTTVELRLPTAPHEPVAAGESSAVH
jgi:two-component system, LytTR family, sensor kinase